MTNIILSFSPEKIEKIDEMCELLGLTRGEYLGKLFGWGQWVADKHQEGGKVLAIDNKEKCYEFISSPDLDTLLKTWVDMQTLLKKS